MDINQAVDILRGHEINVFDPEFEYIIRNNLNEIHLRISYLKEPDPLEPQFRDIVHWNRTYSIDIIKGIDEIVLRDFLDEALQKFKLNESGEY